MGIPVVLVTLDLQVLQLGMLVVLDIPEVEGIQVALDIPVVQVQWLVITDRLDIQVVLVQ